MPNLDKNILQFKNINFQHPVPYIIYADFESLLVPIQFSQPSNDNAFTEKIALHKACGYAYVIVGPDGKPVKSVSVYRGPDAAKHFIQAILREKDVITKKLFNIAPMRLTLKQEEAFKSALTCSICHGKLGYDRVREHNHLTGEYRGAAHNYCNLQFRLRKFIPVVFHNLKNYDAHHIMQVIGDFKEYECEVIASNIEKYITFSLSKIENANIKVVLQFLDSYQFLPTSLQKLVGNMNKVDFHILSQNICPSKIDLLLRKGVYPYEYMDSFERFHENALPPISAFYSILTRESISEEDYSHAMKVWSAFNIQNLGEYHDLYVASDVMQLADVFQNFRKLCLQYYELDPAHVLTLAGYSWHACLKMTAQPLQLFTDIDMYLFIERGIRGGISTICKRHSIANNPYLPNYDASSPSKYIMYLDANNLYGWAMSQPLPYDEMKWMSPDLANVEWILQIPPDSDIGYILEVDLHYPEELHNLHNDYPLAPERMKITEDMTSPTSKDILEKLHNQSFHESEKLVPNLNHKTCYITYYRNLQLYLSLGLKLKKVHKILQFRQKPWLKGYIEFNTQKRAQSTSPFEKDFFKLMNNAVYGKTMENLRNRKDVKLVNNEKKAKKLISAPSLHTYKIFSENLTGVERLKTSIYFNRPIYVGFVILEMSKLLMYQFHYQHIKKQYGEKAELLFTDTDSLMYEIQTDDVYKDMEQHLNLYDTSDYPCDHPLFSTTNKKRVGCFKDELNSQPIQEFVGLRSKMYSYKTSKYEKQTAKGVARQTIRDDLNHCDYLESLQYIKSTKEKMYSIRNERHQLFTIQQNKVALSPYDDKRFIREDGVHTYAYGHYMTKN